MEGRKGYGFEAFSNTDGTDGFETFFESICLENIHIFDIFVKPDKRNNKIIMRLFLRIVYSNLVLNKSNSKKS